MDSKILQTYAPYPFVVTRGEGDEIIDEHGRRYLDFTTGIAVNALGHCHPEVVQALSTQAQKLLHTSNMFRRSNAEQLAHWLSDHSLGGGVFLTNSGTEAMEAALKLALSYHQQSGTPRKRFAAITGGFHGRSLGALALTLQPHYQQDFEPVLAEVLPLTRNEIGDISRIDHSVAAVVVEPIMGNGGIRELSPAFTEALRQRCDEVGALLIADEIQTGIGRTGKWFAYQHQNWVPDLLCTAKALGGGLPLGAMVTRPQYQDVFAVGQHGTTFGGNPVCIAAGLKTIEIIERDGLLKKVEERGASLLEIIRGFESVNIVDVRGRGFLIGVEVRSKATDLRRLLQEHGVLVAGSGQHVIRVLPPLNAKIASIQQFTEALRECS